MPAKGQIRGLKVRFEEKFTPSEPDNCWNWQSASTGRYGVIIDNNKNRLAHRVSYELYKGEIPKGMMVCHTCDNGHCVNPNHLFLGTALDNNNDKIAKGRAAPQNGENNPRSKLTSSQIPLINDLREAGFLQREIAEMFGVRREAISKILRGARWAA